LESKFNNGTCGHGSELEEFISSVKQLGFIEPIIIRKAGSSKNVVVAGNRRLRAARIAKLETVTAIVRDLSDEEAIRIAYIENVHRPVANPESKRNSGDL
jgi:ParB family chromosome partitioning protein